jgi:ankyrin repeat protein
MLKPRAPRTISSQSSPKYSPSPSPSALTSGDENARSGAASVANVQYYDGVVTDLCQRVENLAGMDPFAGYITDQPPISCREFGTPRNMTTSARHAFVVAALYGDMDRVAALWQDGLVTDADCQSDQEACLGWTALQYAAMGGHMAMARFLLERGASSERRTYQRRTPLHLAVKSGHAEMVELLCRRGADVDAGGLGGESALHLALSFPRVVACLLTHGASPNVTNDNGETPLDVACTMKDLAAIKLLIASGADVLRLNRNHETALMRACFNGDDSVVVRMIEALDEAGATETARALVNTPGQRGWTPLCVAATLGNLKVVESLVAHGSVVNTKCCWIFATQ